MRTTNSFMRLVFITAILCAMCACLVSCWSEWKVVEPETKTKDRPAQLSESPKIIIQEDDGSTTLRSPMPTSLISHVRRCLVEGNYDLLYDQLLAEETKKTYRRRGQDPHESISWFVENQRDILILLNRLSGGMSSPHVVSRSYGKNLHMVITGPVAQDLRFTNLEVTQEMGQFKLLMIW